MLLIEDETQPLQCALQSTSGSKKVRILGSFRSAEEAVQANLWDEANVMITGIHLPSMSGISLIRFVKKTAPHVRSLIYTSEANAKMIHAALRAGAVGYVLEGCTGMDLHAAVRAAMQGGAPISPMIAKFLLEEFLKMPADEHYESLSVREIEIVQHLSEGLLYKEVAVALGISPHTVHSHIKNIYQKLKANSRTQAVQYAKDLGYL